VNFQALAEVHSIWGRQRLFLELLQTLGAAMKLIDGENFACGLAPAATLLGNQDRGT